MKIDLLKNHTQLFKYCFISFINIITVTLRGLHTFKSQNDRILIMSGRLEEFLNEYTSPETKRNYSSAVRTFLSYKYGFVLHKKHQSTEELERLRKEADTLVERYFNEDNNYADDFKKYCAWAATRYQPKSCQYYYSALKQFFAFCDIDFSFKESKSIKRQVRKGGTATQDILPSRKEINEVLLHANLKLKTLILLLVSSAIRIDEALSLNYDDVKLCEGYGIVQIRQDKAKNQNQRTTFCSSETVSHLHEWNKIRMSYIDGVNKRQKNKKTGIPSHERSKKLFGFGDVHARDMLKTALLKAGLYKKDASTNRSVIHFHIFRKYFETTVKTHIPPMFSDIWTGHQSEINHAYDIPGFDDQIEKYLSVEPYLRIYDEGVEEIVKQKAVIGETKELIRDLQLEHLLTKSDMDDMRRQNEKMLKQVATLKQMIELIEENRV